MFILSTFRPITAAYEQAPDYMQDLLQKVTIKIKMQPQYK